MAHLKSLTFTVAPQQIARNPKLVRRQRLIDRLEEQQKLAADPAFTVLVRRWVKDPDGIKQPVDLYARQGCSEPSFPFGNSSHFFRSVRCLIIVFSRRKNQPCVRL
jgi:hypothetical protein